MTVLGSGTPVAGSGAVRGSLLRLETPDDVIALLDSGARDVVALVNDAGATFVAPVHADLAGLVCRTGDVGSHLAIVSRDYGIPAVVGFAFTAEEPLDGAAVRLDADDGTLEVES